MKYLIKNACFSPWGTKAAVRRAKAPTNETNRTVAGINVSRIQNAGLTISDVLYKKYKVQFDKAEEDGLIDIVPLKLPEAKEPKESEPEESESKELKPEPPKEPEPKAEPEAELEVSEEPKESEPEELEPETGDEGKPKGRKGKRK